MYVVGQSCLYLVSCSHPLYVEGRGGLRETGGFEKFRKIILSGNNARTSALESRAVGVFWGSSPKFSNPLRRVDVNFLERLKI